MYNISDFYHVLPFELTEGQKRANELVASGNHCLIIGDAGSGKSTVMEIWKSFFGKRAIFCGSTGISNQRLFNYKGGNGTAHKVFSLPLGIAKPKDWKEVSRYTNEILAKSDQIEYIVVEEVSMLNSENIAMMFKRIDRFNKKTKKRRARDIKLILVGDLLQLPCVVDTRLKGYLEENYGSHLFFKSWEFEKRDVKVTFLGQVMRQNDRIFKAALNVLRYGQEERYERVLQWFNKRSGLPLPKNAPLISATNRVVNQANQQALHQNPNESFCYEAEFKDNYDRNACPVDVDLYLKQDLKVMTLINHPEGFYQNGSMGYVVSCCADGAYVQFDHSGETHLVEPFIFEERELYVAGSYIDEQGIARDILDERVAGSFEQLPLKQASAITIHKAQGQTIDSEFILDLGWDKMYTDPYYGDFGTALPYVGWSRSTKIENVFLKGKMTKDHIKVCFDTIEWLISKGAVPESEIPNRFKKENKLC